MTGGRWRYLRSSFGVFLVGFLALAGWSLWTAGLFDAPHAAALRTSSVYAYPGSGLDPAAAAQVVGNRRLTVAFLEPGTDLDQACDDVDWAADGTLSLMIAPEEGELDSYGCSGLHGEDDLGKAIVAETTADNGIDEFVDRPLDALKVIVVNYDLLVAAGALPADARTFQPPLPRYLVAAAAIGAVLLGAVVLSVLARRAGRVAAVRAARRDQAGDDRAVLSAAMAVIAQQIIDLDERGTPGLRRVAADYAELVREITAADRDGSPDFARFTTRTEELTGQLRALA